MHAVDVLRAGLDPAEDHRIALPCPLLSLIGGKDNDAGGRTGRGRQAARDHVALRIRVQRRVEQLIELLRVDTLNRLFLCDQPFIDHVAGDLQGGGRRALAAAGLEHVELAALNGELQVLHVAVVALQAIAHLVELLEDVRHGLFHRRQV